MGENLSKVKAPKLELPMASEKNEIDSEKDSVPRPAKLNMDKSKLDLLRVPVFVKSGESVFRQGPKLKGPKATLLSLGMMGLGLLAGVLLLGNVLPKGSSSNKSGTEVTPSVTIVPTVHVTPEPKIELLGVDDLKFDKDGDAIPDRMEEFLKYDPNQNDCVRELGCGDFPTVPRAKLEINLLFLLDVSGSMGEKLEGVTKWESAKRALIDLLDSGLPEFANVGLIVYGHRGGAEVEKREASCQGVELLEPLSDVNAQRTSQEIANISPAGWTPLAKAIELAGQTLTGKDFAQNFIILLTDGKETCDGDPVQTARGLHESGTEVVTNVVGLVVNEEEKKQLELIAQAGGGRYFGADTREQLQQALVLSAEAIRLWDQVNRCIVDNLSGYGQCINVQYLTALNYVGEVKFELGEKAGGVFGAGFVERDYDDLYSRIWEKYGELRDENWKQYDEDLKKLYPR